jgi:uncharacterized cupin superfamily protein
VASSSHQDLFAAPPVETPEALHPRLDHRSAPVTIEDPFAAADPSPLAVGTDRADELIDAPLADGWVLDGDPRPRMKVNATSPGGAISSGVWCCEPSRFTFMYDVDEYIHLVEGRVTVVAGRHVHQLGPGSTVLFPKGLSTEWTVHEAVRKVFVIANPPRWRRLARRASAMIGR